jgi:diaminopropionate ammonia-lyase
MEFSVNQNLERDRIYGEEERSVVSLAEYERAKAEIEQWSGYSPTCLYSLTSIAEELGVAEIWVKDESTRFGLASFKALGGSYAVSRVLERELSLAEGAGDPRSVTVVCATDGNHGRSVAWGAQKCGCRCVIYVPAHVTERRAQEIASFGAEVVRLKGNYDEAVVQAANDADANGWQVVSDTSYEGYQEIPSWVMQGYALMVEEAFSQLPETNWPTHIFIQGGVGGLAASVCGHLWESYGSKRPVITVVEPIEADCLYRSAQSGLPESASGSLETIMGGLSCGEISSLAWKILRPGIDAFMTVDDSRVGPWMRRLAEGRDNESPIVAGESGVTGLIGLEAVSADEMLRKHLKLDHRSQVMIFSTEGATDPETYRDIVGKEYQSVASSD